MAASLPTGRRGQALAIAMTLAVVVALWLGVAAPLASWYADRSQTLAERSMLAAHMQVIAGMLPEMRRAAAAPLRAKAILLPGGSDALAAAALQEAVNRIGAGAGVTFTSLETLPAVARGGLRRVGLRVALTAPWPRMVALLLAIRRAEPRMLLDDVELRGLPVRSRTESVPVDAGFAVFAFRPA
jgi:hypothetical protein